MTRTEQLPRLTGKPSGQLVTVDKGWLAELLDLVATAIGAVERGNTRAAGVALERRCTAAILSAGSVPAGCPTPLISR